MVPKGAEKEKGSAERADDGGLMRMIDADALIEDIKHGLWDWETVNGIESRTVLEQTIQDIKNEPTIDAEPVRHGKWIEKEVLRFTDNKAIGEWQSARCSVCGKYHTTPYMYYFSHYDYCPVCGAKMDEVNDDK